MFEITDARGFKVTFANGYTISVQFGPLTYSDKRSEAEGAQYLDPHWSSQTAEVTIYNPKGVREDVFDWGDSVIGYQSADQVRQIMNDVADLPAVQTFLRK